MGAGGCTSCCWGGMEPSQKYRAESPTELRFNNGRAIAGTLLWFLSSIHSHGAW